MTKPRTSLEAVEDFLAQKRIAMIGVSRENKDFSAQLFSEFCQRGYDMVPVNPHTPNVQGHTCFARVQDIQPPVEGAILMTSPAVTESVVKDCAEAGVRRIWMYSAGGPGAVTEEALEFCRDRGIQVVPGECPFMFWHDSHAGHRFHGLVLKIFGRYPRRGRAAA